MYYAVATTLNALSQVTREVHSTMTCIIRAIIQV